MQIRIEYEKDNELKKILEDMQSLYKVNYISKKYSNREPSNLKRVYVNLDIYNEK